MHHMKEVYQPTNPLAQKYGILSAPDVVVIKIIKGDWTSGIDSLNLILESME